MRKYFYLFLIFGLFTFSLAKEKGIEARELWETFLLALKKAWQEALEIWKRIWQFFKEIWQKYIFSFLKAIWQRIVNLIKKAF